VACRSLALCSMHNITRNSPCSWFGFFGFERVCNPTHFLSKWIGLVWLTCSYNGSGVTVRLAWLGLVDGFVRVYTDMQMHSAGATLHLATAGATLDLTTANAALDLATVSAAPSYAALASHPGHSILTDCSVRLFRSLQTSVSRIQEPIGLSQEKEPTISVHGFSVRFSVSTEETDRQRR